MHIAFLTLFLGLISGKAPVEVSVTGPGPITVVELLLDGAPAGTIAGPPFEGAVDFGKDLLPHYLVARGVDEQGTEVARAEQWVNLPRPPAEIEAVPQPGHDGRMAAVQLAFQSLTRETPAKVTATFDAKPLAVEGKRVVLPPYAADSGHLLSIQAVYPSGLTSRRDLAFGFGGEISTDLTAIPVRLLGGAKLPTSPAALAGWFEEGGTALRPVAVEEGPGELVVVRTPHVPPFLETLGHKRVQNSVLFDKTDRADRLALLQGEMRLGPEDRIRFIHTSSQRYSGTDLSSELFPSSQDFTRRAGGLYWLLTRALQEGAGATRTADAVAVAGIQARTANQRRAVLLVLDGETADASQYDPATVRRYLAAIHVPLYVWSVRKLADSADPASHASLDRAAAWGEVQEVATFSDLTHAFDRLAADLAAQRIVWLDGRHLPQAITLSPTAKKSVALAAEPGR